MCKCAFVCFCMYLCVSRLSSREVQTFSICVFLFVLWCRHVLWNLKIGSYITMGMGENLSWTCLKLKSQLVLHQNGNGRAVKVQGSSGMRPGIHDYGEMSGHCAPLGKVRTNEMRGQPRDDLGDKQILMTSNSFWFFQAFPWQYSIAGNFCHWSGQKGDYLSQDKSFQRSRMSGCIFAKYKCWWGWWEAVVDTSMYEDEWVVVGCVGVVLERVREILLMPQDGRRRGRTPF